MYKKTFKLLGIIFLLVLSFVYTNEVSKIAKKSNPVMKKIIKYKKAHDVAATEPIIKNGEIIVGKSGNSVDVNNSYENMKSDKTFSEDKIIYKKKKPIKSIKNNYDYFIKRGATSKKEVYLILNIANQEDFDNLTKYYSDISKRNITLFIDGKILEDNMDIIYSMKINNEIYNLGYDLIYKNKYIKITNNMIRSLTLKEPRFCYCDKKDENILKLCKNNKMYTVLSNNHNLSYLEIKKNLQNGAVFSFDGSMYNTKFASILENIFESKGYKLKNLSNITSE